MKTTVDYHLLPQQTVRIDGEGARTGALGLLPHPQTAICSCDVCSYHRVSRVAFFALCHFRQGALPLPLATIDTSRQIQSAQVVRLQLEGTLEVFESFVVLPLAVI